MRQVREETRSPVVTGIPMEREVPYEIVCFGRGARQSPHQQAGIWLMDRDGIEAKPVCEVCGWAEPDWSPDGKSLVFVESDFEETGCNGGLFRLDLGDSRGSNGGGWAGPDPIRLLGCEGLICTEGEPFGCLSNARWDRLDSPRWAPSGDEVLLIVSGPELSGPGERVEGPFHALVAKDPGDPAAALLPVYHALGTAIHEVAWSPDGEQIAMLVGPAVGLPGVERLQIVDRSSTAVVEEWDLADLGLPPGGSSGLDWAPMVPAGRSDPLLAMGGVGQTLYLIQPHSHRHPSELLGWGRRPAFSPDGRQLLFEALPARGAAFGKPYRLDLGSGAVSELGGFWWVQRLAWKRPRRLGSEAIH